MFFGRHESKRRGMPLPFLILRLSLSLLMLTIFILAVYQAYKYFSGTDPLKFNSNQAVISYLTSQNSAKVIQDILSFKMPANFADLKSLLKDPHKYFNGQPQTLNLPTPMITPTVIRPTITPSGKRILRFALVADSHTDITDLRLALSQAKAEGAKFVIGLGDYSDVGTVSELQASYKAFVDSGLPFYVTAGDHDLWDPRNRGLAAVTNFDQIFGTPYQSFGDSNIQFIIVYDGDNYLGVDDAQMEWLKGQLDNLKNLKPVQTFVFLHEPLYHPSSDHYMGNSSSSIKNQATQLRKMFKQAGVGGIFAGDVHYFSQYTDPLTAVEMTVVGAVTEDRNTQTPRFAIVDVYQNGGYNVTDIEIKSQH